MNDSIKPISRWRCHLHPNSSCEMAFVQNLQYHVVSVKETTAYAQTKFNSQIQSKSTQEFWECLNSDSLGASDQHSEEGNSIYSPIVSYVAPIAFCSSVYNYETFCSIHRICESLDVNSLIFSHYSRPSDLLSKHIITDGRNSISLCNKHLLKRINKKGVNRPKYTSVGWIKKLLKYLFPKIQSAKNIPTNTPDWAINLYHNVMTQQQTPTVSVKRNQKNNTPATISEPYSIVRI